MKLLRKYAFVLILLVEFALIYVIVHYPEFRLPISFVLPIVTVVLIILFQNQAKQNLLRIYGLFNNRFGSMLGFLQLLFILIHVGLFTDALHDWFRFGMAQEPTCNATTQAIIYASFLGWLFLLPINMKIERSSPKDRQLLIAPLSLVFFDAEKPSELPFSLVALKDIHQFYKSQGAALNRFLLLTSDEVNKKFNTFLTNFYGAKNQPFTFSDDSIKTFLVEEVNISKEVHIELRHINANANHFESYYAEVESLVENYIAAMKKHQKGFSDANTTFSVLSSTKISTIAMAFLAMPTVRGAVYIPQQKTDQLKVHEFDLSVLNMTKLWSELLSKLGNE